MRLGAAHHHLRAAVVQDAVEARLGRCGEMPLGEDAHVRDQGFDPDGQRAEALRQVFGGVDGNAEALGGLDEQQDAPENRPDPGDGRHQPLLDVDDEEHGPGTLDEHGTGPYPKRGKSVTRRENLVSNAGLI
jgi:hypothetical protein